jgi:hypothetical protein
VKTHVPLHLPKEPVHAQLVYPVPRIYDYD